MLPFCPKVNDPKDLKERVFCLIIKTLCPSKQDWQAKTEFLTAYLETDVQLGQAKLRAASFNDFLAPCFIWKFAAVLDESYQQLQIPNLLDNNFCQQALYVTFNLTIDAARSDLGYTIANEFVPKPQSNKVTLILPHSRSWCSRQPHAT
jgi:hypothetical protein